jgi:hypothetical protein
MSINEWLDRQIGIHPFNETLPNNKKEQMIDTHEDGGNSPNDYAKWKKASKWNMLCDCIYMKL